jgi:uncharacterized Tic20 family protein
VLWRFLNRQRQDSWNDISARRGNFSLQVTLWSLWSLAVVGVGFFTWHADVLAQRPINTLGLVIHCVVAGVIGLVVITIIEMRLEPWRFLDE